MKHGRLSWAKPEELTAEQRELYDRIVGGPRARDGGAVELVDEQGRLHGPFNAMLVAPRLGDPLQALGGAIRYETTLDVRVREIAILVVAAERQSSFEWYFHERVGRQGGLNERELQDILRGEAASSFNECERIVFGTVTRLLRQRDLDDEAFERGVSVLGRAGLMELVTLTGYYDLLALHLRVWRTPLPDGEIDPFAAASDSSGAPN